MRQTQNTEIHCGGRTWNLWTFNLVVHMYGFSPYHAENSFDFTSQPVNAVQGNNRCFFL